MNSDMTQIMGEFIGTLILVLLEKAQQTKRLEALIAESDLRELKGEK